MRSVFRLIVSLAVVIAFEGYCWAMGGAAADKDIIAIAILMSAWIVASSNEDRRKEDIDSEEGI